MNNDNLFDQPTHHPPFDENNDFLDYQDYAEAIYQQIRGTKPKNMGITYGILGEWGMGKTAVLNLLSKKLKEHKSNDKSFLYEVRNFFRENPFIVIRFDAWQYLRQEELWLALIRKITYTLYLDKSVSKIRLFVEIWLQRLTKNPKLVPALLRYIVFVLLCILSTLGLSYLLSHLSFFEAVIKEIGVSKISIGSFDINITEWTIVIIWVVLSYKTIKNLAFEQILVPPLMKKGFDQGQSISIDDFKDDFYAMVRSLGGEKTLVILIDDLDRCPPHEIVPILEAIKQLGFDGSYTLDNGLSNMAKIVFVLAIDQIAVEHALSGYFKEYFQGTEKERDIYKFARNYMAKIIQVPIILPPLSEIQLEKMLSKIMNKE